MVGSIHIHLSVSREETAEMQMFVISEGGHILRRSCVTLSACKIELAEHPADIAGSIRDSTLPLYQAITSSLLCMSPQSKINASDPCLRTSGSINWTNARKEQFPVWMKVMKNGAAYGRDRKMSVIRMLIVPWCSIKLSVSLASGDQVPNTILYFMSWYYHWSSIRVQTMRQLCSAMIWRPRTAENYVSASAIIQPIIWPRSTNYRNQLIESF